MIIVINNFNDEAEDVVVGIHCALYQQLQWPLRGVDHHVSEEEENHNDFYFYRTETDVEEDDDDNDDDNTIKQKLGF